MPIIKSAIKRVKQARKRQERNYALRSEMKTYVKKILVAAKEGDKGVTDKFLPKAYKLVDTAAKKNILHKNNAAHKKSRMAKAVANMKPAKPEVTK